VEPKLKLPVEVYGQVFIAYMTNSLHVSPKRKSWDFLPWDCHVEHDSW